MRERSGVPEFSELPRTNAEREPEESSRAPCSGSLNCYFFTLELPWRIIREARRVPTTRPSDSHVQSRRLVQAERSNNQHPTSDHSHQSSYVAI